MTAPVEPNAGQIKPRSAGDPAPLNRWERTAAALAGVTGSVAGGVAVFVTDNQAGTAALLVAGVAFLLIGIQGTALKRIGSGDQVAEFDLRAANEVVDKAEAVRAAGQPERDVEALVDVAIMIDPSVEHRPFVREVRYAQRVGEALDRIFGQKSVLREPVWDRGRRPDFQLVVNGHDIDVEVLHHLWSLVDLELIAEEAARSGQPILAISDTTVPPWAMEFNSMDHAVPVEVVSWRGGNDDDLLQRAVLRLSR
ncbi:hypothetical protein FCG67_03785 [Rhodococcus oryzae]|uniref:Uncharacterized protein n=1 Tax=Rhodococcus oryzae TaxID=2571143 RepID=A0ABY2RNQ0_9NOCA|nr:hypothetical protein [Rhodococcus oryzae]TJZ80022.1 hypothetical protein FCG67_03785 [Rhodococcus oryzae]